jgi:hypothetical protein
MIPIVEVEALLISSTGDILLVDTDSGAIAARLVGAEGIGVTTKDESEEYSAGTRSLDVNVRSGIVQVRLTGENLRYEEITKNQSLTNGSYITIYEHTTSTGSQKIIWTRCVFNNNDINIRVTVDSNIVMDNFYLDELYRDYEIDTSFPGVEGLDFIHTEKQGKVLVLNFPGGMEFTDYFKIEAKANQTNLEMTRGLVVRSEG